MITRKRKIDLYDLIMRWSMVVGMFAGGVGGVAACFVVTIMLLPVGLLGALNVVPGVFGYGASGFIAGSVLGAGIGLVICGATELILRAGSALVSIWSFFMRKDPVSPTPSLTTEPLSPGNTQDNEKLQDTTEEPFFTASLHFFEKQCDRVASIIGLSRDEVDESSADNSKFDVF